jgi:hypothetical protein
MWEHMRFARVIAGTLAGLFVATMVACGGSDDQGGTHSGSKEPGSDAFNSTSATAPSGGPGQCVATVAHPERAKLDIIFVIDNSGSMYDEMTQIRANVNRFAQKIESTGFDYRVLFIVRKATGVGAFGDVGICVPAPLAGASCADNPPKFYHIDQDIQSSNSFENILGTYDDTDSQFRLLDVNAGRPLPPTWQDKLRLDSTKIFVEVTDEESGMKAEDFDRALLDKQPAGMFGTAQKRKYIFHSIISKPASATAPSTKICATARGTSLEYQKLSQMTGGLMDEVCKTDYSAVLDNIAKGISDKLGCELGYPGAGIDPSKVVVQYTATGKAAANLTQVTDVSKCGQIPNAWYYDSAPNPQKIILCPTTCTSTSATTGAKIEALVGCQAPAPR